MTLRTLIVLIAAAGLAGASLPGRAWSAPTEKAPAAEAPAAKDRSAPQAKTRPRRVIIFGTTIVGDVLKPPIEKTVPWQRPAAFRSNAPPLAHDFMTELLTPLDRDEILRDAGEHEP